MRPISFASVQETRKSQKQRLRQGFWLGGAPFGYCNRPCSKCTDPNGMDYGPDFGGKDQSDGTRLIAHPIDGAGVSKVFDWYKTGICPPRIAEPLNNYELILANG